MGGVNVSVVVKKKINYCPERKKSCFRITLSRWLRACIYFAQGNIEENTWCSFKKKTFWSAEQGLVGRFIFKMFVVECCRCCWWLLLANVVDRKLWLMNGIFRCKFGQFRWCCLKRKRRNSVDLMLLAGY